MVFSWFLCLFFILFIQQVEVNSYATTDLASNNCCKNIDFDHCKTDCCNAKEEKFVVCYFTNWASYRPGIASFKPENLNASLCTHIMYAFTFLDVKTHLMNYSDSWADIDNHFIEEVTNFKQKGVKSVSASIGGWTNSESQWSTMLNNEKERKIFVDNACQFLIKNQFDGIDVDPEYPMCLQGKFNTGPPEEKENYNKLIKELKQTCTNKNGQKILVTATVPAGKELLDKCYNLSGLCKWVDWVHIMAYDYASASDNQMGALAPLCGTGSAWGVFESVKYILSQWNCLASKLVLGIPFYGITFTLKSPASSAATIWGAPSSGPGEEGIYTKNNGSLAYYEICKALEEGFECGNNKINNSYAFKGNQGISFDNKTDIIRKSCLIISENLKGAMVWTPDYDDFNNMCGGGSYPLLTLLNKKLRCLKPSTP